MLTEFPCSDASFLEPPMLRLNIWISNFVGLCDGIVGLIDTDYGVANGHIRGVINMLKRKLKVLRSVLEGDTQYTWGDIKSSYDICVECMIALLE